MDFVLNICATINLKWSLINQTIRHDLIHLPLNLAIMFILRGF